MPSNKQSARAAARDALRVEKRAASASPMMHGVATTDSFVNFAHKLGVGADNALSSSTYGFNPITRNRTLLEWIHRGSWLGGMAVDLIADDMTRKGIEFACKMAPEDSQKIDGAVARMGIWTKLNETIKWGRLYGGSVCVMLVDGQDFKTPLRLDTVGKGQFKGLLPLDRWQVEPTTEDLVTEFGPHLGLPKFYRVLPSAPALRGSVIHHSRIAVRLEGVSLPWQQRLTENLWGISVLERLYDRMIAFDSATTGAAQLVFKAYLRTMKIEGFRDIVAGGGKPLEGLLAYTQMMRRYQGQEGITLIDLKDEFEVQSTSAFSGIDDLLVQFAQQISGALQIPLVRMLGQSPAGLNSTGESDIRTYYDGINHRQEQDLGEGVATIYQLTARSEGVSVPPDFGIAFASLWDLDDVEKADVASKITDAITKAKDAGLFGRATSLKELLQSSRRTGIFTNITQEMIDEADDEVLPPLGEDVLNGLPGGEEGGNAGPNGQAKPLATGARRRVDV